MRCKQALVGLVLSTTVVAAQTLPHSEVMRGQPPLQPAPFTAYARAISSTPAAAVVEVTIDATDPQRLPSADAVPVGLVAIDAFGEVEASILQVDAAPIGDLSRVAAVSPATAPVHAVHLGTPAIWRDLRVVDVSVSPSWAASGGDLLARRLLIEIRNTGGVGVNEKAGPARPISPVWERIYRQHVVNYDLLGLPRLTRGTGSRYLVISRTMFDSQTPQFAEWKTRQGYGVEVKTLESLGYSGNTITSPECLNATKNYILNAYNTWPDGLDFVLLVGDIESGSYNASIWTSTFYNEINPPRTNYYDQWYGFLEGSDVFADVMVGRFPDVHSGRMGYQLDKTRRYESEPHIEGSWQKNALMTLDTDSQTTTALKNLVSDLLTAWGMNVTEAFSDPWQSTIENAVNQGVTFYNYRGTWCSEYNWGNTFGVDNVSNIDNTHKPGVWTVLSCSSAEFESSQYSSIAAEEMLRLGYGSPSTPEGAVAFFGSQGYTDYAYNNPLDEGFYRCWTDSGASILGQAFLSGKIWAWNHMYPGYNPTWRECMMREYTLLGDPSLQVWTDVPRTTSVALSPTTLVAGQAAGVTVTVTHPGHGLVPEALVCIWKAGEVYVWGYTDAAGQVTLTAAPSTVGNADLTVTAYNHQPVLSTIPVVAAPGPCVVYDAISILGDGYADVGDTVWMNVQLRNVGTQLAPAVQGTLNTAEPAILMLTSVRNYGDIEAGAAALPYNPFRFLLGTLADGTPVPFSVAAHSGDSTWTSGFSVTIRAPILAVQGSTIDDASGNNNGMADPGETIGLALQVKNNGTGPARSVDVTLAVSDPYVSVSGSSAQSLGDIAAGAQTTSPAFALVVSPTCPPGHTVSLVLSFSSNYGTYAAISMLDLGVSPVLFVDADDEATETRITDALAEIGWSFVRWNTYESGMATVPLDTLLRYRTVLWAAGDQNQNSVTQQNQSNLASYLSAGGSLLLSAENYSTSYSGSSFGSDYLQVASFTSSSGTAVDGVNGDPIDNGVSVSLSYHEALSDLPDRINPSTGAATVFTMTGSGDPVVIRYPASGSASYRVVFFGAPLEAFTTGAADPHNIETVLDRCLTWLSGDLSAPTTPSGPGLSADGTLSWSPASDDIGVDHYRVYRHTLPFYDVVGMTPHVTTASTSAMVPEGMGDPNVNYFYRVTAVDAADNESEASDAVGEMDYVAP